VLRDHCGGCGNTVLREFLDLGSSPLANDLPKTIDQRERYYPLRVAVCQDCWLVQMMVTPPASEVFGGDYTFYSSTSPSLVAYHRSYAAELLFDKTLGQDDLVVEVACNDGDLLQHFHNAGVRAVGIDPAAGPVGVARDRGLTVEHTALSLATALGIREKYGPARLVLANHVTAHVIDLNDFLDGVHALLAEDGRAILEVQYLPDLLVGNQFDHVYHEHRYFFSLTSLMAAAKLSELTVTNVKLVPQQGGSMQVTFMRDAFIRRAYGHEFFSATARDLHVHEGGIRELDTYTGTQMRADRVRDRLLELLTAEHRDGRTVAGYGMPAKAATLLNFCAVDRSLVSHIVDTTPAKIGRYAPGVKIPVVGPNDRNEPDTYLVLVWNYLRGIMQREQKFTSNGGRLIVPIPVPVIL
jgi:SAM-dependent methyltransferase